MKITFSMDGIKNMDQLYTWTIEQLFEIIPGKAEHYHGKEYCERIIESLSSWKEKKYLGMVERIGNEMYTLIAPDESEYTVAFGINTYEEKLARIEVVITAPDTDSYDQRLEDLKIELKNVLLPDWQECTWLVDEQAAKLCKEAYEQAFVIENNLRAFASKVLIHFLGVNWIKRAGFEKEAGSVAELKTKFIQRIPEFDNINADFLSMTLETLSKIMLDGVVYKDEIVLSRKDYGRLMEICSKAKSPSNVADFVKAQRVKEKTIWDDLFAPFIVSPDTFKTALHDFIEDRNHVAHSKVLSWNSYQLITKDFQKINTLILQADSKFDEDESSSELIATWNAEQEEEYDPDYEKEYLRSRIADETGMDILSEQGISDWFDEALHDLFSAVYQRYHLNMEFEVSDFFTPSEEDVVFSVSCPVDENLHIIVYAEYSIDDDLGEDSTCYIRAVNGKGEKICSAEIRFHNGNGVEGENGLMEATDNTEYDTSELDEFKEELFAAIDTLNPYPAEAEAIAHRSKGIEQVTADFACEQCSKFGVSICEEFLPIGKCCYCGWENELVKCDRCGELVSVDAIEDGFCPSCHAFIEKQ